MGSRKVTSTLDEGLLADAEAFMEETGQTNMSGLIAVALRQHITRESLAHAATWRSQSDPEGEFAKQWDTLTHAASREIDTLRGGRQSAKGDHAA
jgi:hypothetical protein